MPRRSQQSDPEFLRQHLIRLLTNFKEELLDEELRHKVLALIPIHETLRDLGSSLIPPEVAASAINRILSYLLKYPYIVINSQELMVVAGINDYPRRVRELRTQFGWTILSGQTAKEYASEEGGFPIVDVDVEAMRPDDYILIDVVQDKEAAFRWNVANSIRKSKGSGKDKILRFLRENVGNPVTGEELRYVADNDNEWARRVRELRSEQGWPISTRNTGRPDLKVSIYVLEQDRQSPPHDRAISDEIRRKVLRRDGYRCRRCDWTHSLWNPSDPRHLELHHVRHHVAGGENDESNLITLCTVCHDVWHRDNNEGKQEEFTAWLSSQK